MEWIVGGSATGAVVAMAKAVTISGEATKACVTERPSLRLAKLRLNEVMIEFLRVGSSI